MTSFVVIREISSLTLRNATSPSLMIWSIEYLHPTFFTFKLAVAIFHATYHWLLFLQ